MTSTLIFGRKVIFFMKGTSMLLSLALIVLLSLTLSQIFIKLKLPGLVAMLLTGIILGPYVLNLIDSSLLDLSLDLRQIALIVILLRAGLTLDLKDLKRVGRPALLLSFIPATFEIIAVVIFAPMLFEITYLQAAMMGAVLAAVSPAVIVPRMIKLIESNRGTNKSIPQMIMAGASVDDIYVIVLFASFVQMAQSNTFSALSILALPLTILSGVALGVGVGSLLVWFFRKIHIRDTIKVMILFSFAFLFIAFQEWIKPVFSISGLIAVMTMGITILKQYVVLAKRLVGKFEKIWVFAEIILFVLVGAAVDIGVIPTVGLKVILLIFIALIIRCAGVLLTLIKTQLTKKERLFVVFSYLPKATVQAAIGSIPLGLGLPGGALILAVAVISILITAPLGAVLIDATSKRWLEVTPIKGLSN